MSEITILGSAKGKTVHSVHTTISDGRVTSFIFCFSDGTRVEASVIVNFQSTEEQGAVVSMEISE